MTTKPRVIKSERVQKMVLNKMLNKVMYASTIFRGEYKIEIEDKDKSYRKLVVSPVGIADDFFTSIAFMEFTNSVKDIMEKYTNVFWCVAVRPHYDKNMDLYHVPAIEFYAPVNK